MSLCVLTCSRAEVRRHVEITPRTGKAQVAAAGDRSARQRHDAGLMRGVSSGGAVVDRDAGRASVCHPRQGLDTRRGLMPFMQNGRDPPYGAAELEYRSLRMLVARRSHDRLAPAPSLALSVGLAAGLTRLAGVELDQAAEMVEKFDLAIQLARPTFWF
jgi:hypothetical protein